MSAPAKLVILDRDGVINSDSDEYVKSAAEWKAIPRSLAAIAKLCAAGYRVIVVSNQSGIGRGLLDVVELDRIHAKMRAAIEAAGGQLAGIYYCPHTPEEGCDCRKPRPGLLLRAQADQGFASLAGVPVIGDKLVDLELARNVGGRGILVLTGKGQRTASTLAAAGDREVYPDLAAAVDALLAGSDE